MRLFLTIVTSVPLCAVLALAQPAADSNRSMQSWTGLLVAAGCQNSGTATDFNRSTVSENGMAKTTPGSKTERNTTYEDTLNQADRGTPMPDRTGARKTPGAAESTSNMKNSTPETANVNDSNRVASEDAWLNAQKTAASLDNSCQIGNKTASFALRLPDGRMIPFDDASNRKIGNQIQSTNRLGNMTKIFRVVVQGTMEGDRISMDSIKI